MIALLAALFAASGAAALAFETVWFRLASLVFGSGAWASTLVLAGFMAGLAAGNAGIARVGHRIRRPLRAYAGLELALGASGVALVLAFPHLDRALAPLFRAVEGWPAALGALRFAIAFGLLALPSAAMGATLPVLVEGVERIRPDFGRSLALLYGANTLGAMGGVLAAELVGIGALGLTGTGVAAGAVNGAVALAALGLERRAPAAGGSARSPSETMRLTPRAIALLAATFLCGAVLLALEVLWFRLLVQWTLGTSLVFAVMLATVLAGIGAGGLAASAWLAREDAARRLPYLALASALVVFAGYGLVAFAERPALDLWNPTRLTYDGLLLMFPTAVLSGLLFAGIGQRLARELPGATRATGWLVVANTAGAAIGALAGGLLLLPALGSDLTLLLIASTMGVAAGLVTERAEARRAGTGVALLLAGLSAFALLAFRPMRAQVLPELARPYQADGSRVVAMREGRTETLVYLERELLGRPYEHRLITNGYSMSASTPGARRYMRLFAHLPAVLHPELHDALLISFGIGTTAKALTEIPTLERIDVVDLSRDILELERVPYPDPATAPLADPRVRVHVEDGRQHLERTTRRYDLITGEPPPPLMAGVVNLYTREHFALIRERLAPGGIVSWWLPMHSLTERESRGITRAFCAVFDECSLWLGAGPDWILVGFRDPPARVTAERLAAAWRDPTLGPALRDIGLERPEQLGALFVADAESLLELTRDVPPVVDDFPHRIAPRPARSGESRYAELLDPGFARERFRASPLARRLFDATTRERMAPDFAWRRTIHDALAPPALRAPGFERRDALADLLAGSDLEVPALWLLGSDPRAVRIAEAARAEGQGDPRVDLHLGHAALARRDYAEAERHYAALAASHPDDASVAELAADARCLTAQPPRVCISR